MDSVTSRHNDEMKSRSCLLFTVSLALVLFSQPSSFAADAKKKAKAAPRPAGPDHVPPSLFTVPKGNMVFLDAGGVCVILVKRPSPINRQQEDSDGVHHSFILESQDYKPALEHLRKNGVEVFFEEDRRGGVVNGPRAYFRDPDGTVLEYIDLTGYMGAQHEAGKAA